MKQLTYIIALATALVGGIGVALAETVQPSFNTPTTATHSSLTDISIPSDIGYTLEVHPVSPALSQASSRTIIHIQEAHTNYEGQQHLAAMLEELIQRHGVKLILVEGGTGNASLDHLRRYGTLKQRKQVADEQLRLGLITGEEYLDVTTTHELQLWGVEEPDLYKANIRLFMEVTAMQPQLRKALASVREAVEILKPKVYPQPLLDLEQLSRQFDEQKISLPDYALKLKQQAEALQVALDGFPNFRAMALVGSLYGQLKREELPKEQTLLMARLSKLIEPASFDSLIEQAKQMKAGTLAREIFYKHLQSVIDQAKADMQTYPNLVAYMRALQTADEISVPALSKELDALGLQLRSRLADTPPSKTVLTVAGQLELMEKFVELKLAPGDYQAVEQLMQQQFTFSWPVALNEQLKALGLNSRSYEGLDHLSACLPTVEQFYAVTQSRDQVLAANALAKLNESRETVAVLITGGFHGPEIAKQLGGAGVGVVVMVPRMSQATDDRLYQAVLKYKSGLGSLAEVESAAPAKP